MKKLSYAVLSLFPSLVLAQTGTTIPSAGSPQLTGIQTLIESIRRIVGIALPVVVGLALLGFFWGLMKFIFSAGNEEAKDEGKRIMIYGIIALFVMVAVWGLVGFIAGALGVGTGGTANVPGFPQTTN
jgi:hypothetical protein